MTVAPRRPIAELFAIAGPTIAQMAGYTVMQFADTAMLAHFGKISGTGDLDATACANSGFLTFAIMSFGVGTLFIVNALVSQAFGRKDDHEAGRYLWAGNWFGVVFSLLVLCAFPFSHAMFSAAGHAPELVQRQVTYMHLTLAFTAVKLVGTSFGQFLLAIDRAALVLWSSVAAVLVTIGVNWLLIYGKLGFPQMGIAGAAWGLNVAVCVETALLAFFALRPDIRRRFNSADWKPRRKEIWTLIKIGLPSGLQVASEVFAWTLFCIWIIPHLGPAANAANVYMLQYMKTSFMPAFGLSVAVTALVGRYIGAGEPETAVKRANLAFRICAAYMISCGLVFIAFGRPLIGFLSTDPLVQNLGVVLLTYAAAYQFFDSLYITYNGALRGAGDTRVPATVMACLCWSIVVGGGATMVYARPNWGVHGPWITATCYGLIMATFIYTRFRRGKWKQITLDPSRVIGH